jgi:hypothetical protein
VHRHHEANTNEKYEANTNEKYEANTNEKSIIHSTPTTIHVCRVWSEESWQEDADTDDKGTIEGLL